MTLFPLSLAPAPGEEPLQCSGGGGGGGWIGGRLGVGCGLKDACAVNRVSEDTCSLVTKKMEENDSPSCCGMVVNLIVSGS